MVMRGRGTVKTQGIIKARAEFLSPPILIGVSVIGSVVLVCGVPAVAAAIASTNVALRALADASIVEIARAIGP